MAPELGVESFPSLEERIARAKNQDRQNGSSLIGPYQFIIQGLTQSVQRTALRGGRLVA